MYALLDLLLSIFIIQTHGKRLEVSMLVVEHAYHSDTVRYCPPRPFHLPQEARP